MCDTPARSFLRTGSSVPELFPTTPQRLFMEEEAVLTARTSAGDGEISADTPIELLRVVDSPRSVAETQTPSTPRDQLVGICVGSESPAKRVHHHAFSPHPSYYGSDPSTCGSEWTPDLIEGTRFASEFVELEVLGKGSYGIVSKVRHRLDGQLYAVKSGLRPFAGAQAKETRLQEVYAVASLPRCQHIVKYHDCWIEQDTLYIRFEYCEGGNITAKQSWTYSELVVLLYQMSIGLQSLHTQSIVHLDIKPENIFQTNKNGRTIYKLGDFGLVRKVGEGDECMGWMGANQDEGDSRYLCQAFLRGEGNPKAADVFSLGATVYEMASGKPLPAHGEEWQEVRKAPVQDLDGRYPDEFVKLLQQCMHPNPRERPTCLDILQSPIFDHLKRGHQQYPLIQSMEAEISRIRRLLATPQPSPSPPGLSPSEGTPSPQVRSLLHCVRDTHPPPSFAEGTAY